MDEISEQHARMEHFRRKLAWRKTPEERMRDMVKLQNRMWAILRSSPQGYAHFMRRNFKARAVSYKEPNGG